MKICILPLIAALTLTAPMAADAGNWSVSTSAFGVLVSNSETGESFHAPTEKAGKKMAKKLNKIEDKNKDGGSQVRDDGSGNCESPFVLC